jgi:hypothetical protein
MSSNGPLQASRLLRVHLHFIPTDLLDRRERRSPRIQLFRRGRGPASFQLLRHRDGRVSTESFAHVDETASEKPQIFIRDLFCCFLKGVVNERSLLAIRKTLHQLLTACRKFIGQGRSETVQWRVSLDHDAVGFLETLRQRLSCLFPEGQKVAPPESVGRKWRIAVAIRRRNIRTDISA